MKRAAALLMMVLCGPVNGQSLTQFDRGTQAFRAVLNRCGLEPLETLSEAMADPSHSVVVLLGNLEIYDGSWSNGRLRRFIRQGGAVLMASDRSNFGEMFVQLDIGINGLKMIGPEKDPGTWYRESLRDCPLLQQPIRANLKSPLDLLGALSVATNRPSFFNRRPLPGEAGGGPLDSDVTAFRLNQFRVIAELPTGSETMDGMKPVVPENRFLFALADTYGKGRYAVLADHSLFLNFMMLQTDNDNIAFSVKLTNWLTDQGQRRHVHFLDDGKVRTDFNLNIDYVDPPLPHPDVIGPLVDQLVGDLEHSDFFNNGIRRLVLPRRIVRSVLMALTVMAAGFFLVKTVSSRFRPDRAEKRLGERLADLGTETADESTPMPAALDSSAQELARGTLERLQGSSFDRRHEPVVAGNPAWISRVAEIWEIAVGKARRVTKPAELERLARDLIDLERAVERGDVQLTTGANA